MTSIELEDATAAAIEAQARRAGLSVDAYLRRLQLQESVSAHAVATSPDEAEAASREAEQAQAEVA